MAAGGRPRGYRERLRAACCARLLPTTRTRFDAIWHGSKQTTLVVRINYGQHIVQQVMKHAPSERPLKTALFKHYSRTHEDKLSGGI